MYISRVSADPSLNDSFISSQMVICKSPYPTSPRKGEAKFIFI
jgi:hypothetical protein